MLYHTSPYEINSIHDNGLYGSFLFFSSSVYHMTGFDNPVVYALDDDAHEIKIVRASSLFSIEDGQAVCKEYIDAVCEMYDVWRGTAMDLLDGTVSEWDLFRNYVNPPYDEETAATMSWKLQHYQALCAKALGYDGVAVKDETGTAYIIDGHIAIKNWVLHNEE